MYCVKMSSEIYFILSQFIYLLQVPQNNNIKKILKQFIPETK